MGANSLLKKRSTLKGKNLLPMEANSEKRSTLKGKNLLPMGANSLLKKKIYSKRKEFAPYGSKFPSEKRSTLKGKNLLPVSLREQSPF